MNDHLILGDFVKDEVGIGWDWQPSDRGIIGASVDERVIRQELNESLNARLNTPRALRRVRRDAAEQGLEIS
jgi:hypothetical protein